jgi:hypothetical protein
MISPALLLASLTTLPIQESLPSIQNGLKRIIDARTLPFRDTNTFIGSVNDFLHIHSRWYVVLDSRDNIPDPDGGTRFPEFSYSQIRTNLNGLGGLIKAKPHISHFTFPSRAVAPGTHQVVFAGIHDFVRGKWQGDNLDPRTFEHYRELQYVHATVESGKWFNPYAELFGQFKPGARVIEPNWPRANVEKMNSLFESLPIEPPTAP